MYIFIHIYVYIYIKPSNLNLLMNVEKEPQTESSQCICFFLFFFRTAILPADQQDFGPRHNLCVCMGIVAVGLPAHQGVFCLM